MRLLSAKTKKVLRDSAQTFVLAVVLFGFAICLTFVEDWCKKTHRPPWLLNGIEIVSIAMFVTDLLVILAICVRVIVTALKETIESARDE